MTNRILTDTVRVTPVAMSRRGLTTAERPMLLFTLSADVVAELFRLHDKIFLPFVYGSKEPGERFRRHRIEFARFRDIGIPAVLIRIEAPTYDPHGSRIQRRPKSHAFQCVILARKLRVRSNIGSKTLETMWSEQMRGVICTFPDEDMEYPGEKIRLERPKEKEIPVNDRDMIVR